ncbi:MAG: hypothetical protein H6617_01160 [Bdellovibrionaceae bacterium]|nr:hypothetical protein [Pseudobdellovibrionaceae bacterium]
MRIALACLLSLCFYTPAFAKTLQTNSVTVDNAPAWLTEARIRKASRKVEEFLEWDTRRVRARWYNTQTDFEKAHGLGPLALAATDRKKQLIHIGPGVNEKNFDGIFGHELAHIIVIQKYKQAIPAWLEEGLANYAGSLDGVDYKYLNSRKYIPVASLTHPYRSGADTKYHYQASTALMKMIAEKCPIQDLLQLSVGKSIETYLKTFCEIPDLDAAFQKWLKTKASK